MKSQKCFSKSLPYKMTEQRVLIFSAVFIPIYPGPFQLVWSLFLSNGCCLCGIKKEREGKPVRYNIQIPCVTHSARTDCSVCFSKKKKNQIKETIVLKDQLGKKSFKRTHKTAASRNADQYSVYFKWSAQTRPKSRTWMSCARTTKHKHLTANQQVVETLRSLAKNVRGGGANREEEREREADGSVWLSITTPADIWANACTGVLRWERTQSGSRKSNTASGTVRVDPERVFLLLSPRTLR